MATEIFIEPELQNLEDEATAAEWFDLVTDLGLTNQISLADKSETKKAPPYMFIDPKTNNVISALCPRRVDYKNYKESTIPLDVLMEIKKCEVNGWYKKIEIAYDDKSPDPFVIGTLPSEHDWNAPKHLIARWGAELIPFEQLTANAIARLRGSAKHALEKMKFTVGHGLDNLDDFIDGLLSGKDKPVFDSIGTGRSWDGGLPF